MKCFKWNLYFNLLVFFRYFFLSFYHSWNAFISSQYKTRWDWKGIQSCCEFLFVIWSNGISFNFRFDDRWIIIIITNNPKWMHTTFDCVCLCAFFSTRIKYPLLVVLLFFYSWWLIFYSNQVPYFMGIHEKWYGQQIHWQSDENATIEGGPS